MALRKMRFTGLCTILAVSALSVLGTTSAATAPLVDDGKADIYLLRDSKLVSEPNTVKILDAATDFHTTVYSGSFQKLRTNHSFADFNADGISDLYSITPQPSKLQIKNGSSLSSTLFTSSNAFFEQANGDTFRPADFNGDNKADMFVLSTVAPGAVQVFDAAGGFATAQSWALNLPSPATGNTRIMDVGDYNGDGRADIFAIDSQAGSSTVRVRVLGAQSQYQNTALDVAVTLAGPVSGADRFRVGDFDADTSTDLYVANLDASGTLRVQVLDGFSDYATTLSNQTVVNTGATSNWDILTTSYARPESATEGAVDPDYVEPGEGEFEFFTLPAGNVEVRAFSSGSGGTTGRPFSLSAAAQDTIPFSRWRACGNFDDRNSLVRKYRRVERGPRMVGDAIAFRCGLEVKEGNINAYGFRHVKDGHQGDWQRMADYIGRQWSDVAGWAMDFTADDPDTVTISSTYRHCQDREFGLFVDDELVKKFRAILYLGETGQRVITFYPTTKNSKCIKADTPFNNILWQIESRV